MLHSSSDESSKAPENFQVCHDDDLSDGQTMSGHHRDGFYHTSALSDGSQKLCPLCCTAQRKFYCRICVKNGHFIHSGLTYGENLSEKQQRYLNLQAGLKVFSARYERLIKEQKSIENLRFAIRHKKERLEVLKKAIECRQKKVRALEQERVNLHNANADKRRALPNYPIKVRELGNCVLDRREKMEEYHARLHTLWGDIKNITRNDVVQLVRYIFPISELVLKDELNERARVEPPAENAATVAALADAKNTSYIRGKWVFHGSGISEMQYRIVAPSLPANGDYTAYLDWLSENKDGVPKASTEITPSRNSAYRITGALTFTAQLTMLMSYYLNVHLPHKMVYGDFCRKLSEEQFLRKVSRLNANIMYLAYTQCVKLEKVHFNHTLENILTILDVDKSDLGRHGPCEISNAPKMKPVESILQVIETESESEEENSLRMDWEAVSSLSQEELNLVPPMVINQQTSMAEGLMTSAANRINSLLRWMK